MDSSNNLTLDVDAANAGSNSIFNVKIDGGEKIRLDHNGKYERNCLKGSEE